MRHTTISAGSEGKVSVAAVNQALDRIEELCQKRGVRLTRLRRTILGLLIKNEHPIRAYELLDKLDDRVGAKVPATIYRALNFLIKQRYVHKIESLNAFVACVDINHPHDTQFMICVDCGSAIEIHDPSITRALRRNGEKVGFQLNEQIIEVRGFCAACQAKRHNTLTSPNT
jgi:Fur family transcriptional regulator, zinc uptake regulator